MIGEIREVHVSCGGPSIPCNLPGEPVPEHIDWDLWLGPAPWRPFHPQLADKGFRPFRDYSGGGMTDWGCHHFDLAQWALGMDASGPVEVMPPDGKDVKWLTYRYANGTMMTHESPQAQAGCCVCRFERSGVGARDVGAVAAWAGHSLEIASRTR